MPESKVRKGAAKKVADKAAKAADGDKSEVTRAKPAGGAKKDATGKPRKTPRAPSTRRWVPPTFITVGLLGVAWLITYYIAGTDIPFMAALGNWNVLIGMGGMALAFILATLWK